MLAGVNPDYYSRLEQGRQSGVCRTLLDALARAFGLDETEHAHLIDPADPSARPRHR